MSSNHDHERGAARAETKLRGPWAGAWIACVWLAARPLWAAGAQEPQLEPVGGSDPQREIVELFGKVEARLREIDRLLIDAGAGDVSALEKVGPAGIDEILQKSRQKSEETIQDIDKILELARSMQQPSPSSSGQGSPQSQPGQGEGQSPLDGQSQGNSQRENTPSGPENQGGQQPKPDGNKPDGQGANQPSPEKDGQKPGENGKPSNANSSASDPKNRASGPPPGTGQGSPSSPSDARDRWGDLPVHARDVFRNEGGRDMPVQYREWIDAYYRRLNQKRP